MSLSIKNNRLHLQCRYAIINWIIYAVMAALIVLATAHFWMKAGENSPQAFVFLFVGLIAVIFFYKLWHSAMKERLVKLDIDRRTGALNVERNGLLLSEARQLHIDDIDRIEFRTLSSSSEGLFYRAAMVFSDGDEVASANGILRDSVAARAEKVVKFLRLRRGDLHLNEVQA